MKTVISARTLVLVSALALLVVVCGCDSRGKKGKRRGERENRVRVENLQKRIFRQEIPVQGTVTPVVHARISAKNSGTLEDLRVDEGDIVKKGDTLFCIDRQVLKNQEMVCLNEVNVKKSELENARITLELAEINLKKATQDYQRYRNLRRVNAASQSEFENFETLYKQAQTGVKSARAAIDNAMAQQKKAEGNLIIARKNLADSILKAPFECVVTNKFIEQNEYVSAGKEILELESHENLKVVCYISSVYYNAVKKGVTPVEFVLDGKSLGRGVVTFRAPSIDPESRTFKLEAEIPPSIKELVSGALCDLKVILQEKEAYGLPADAFLLRAGNRYIVYSIDEKSRAQAIEVKRGIVDGKYCELLNPAPLMKTRFVVSGQTFINTGSLLREITPQK